MFDYDKIVEAIAKALEKHYVANELRFNQYELAEAALTALQGGMPDIEEYREWMRNLPQNINPPSNDVGEMLYNQLKKLKRDEIILESRISKMTEILDKYIEDVTK